MTDNEATEQADPLVGKWFQSYDRIRYQDLVEGGSDYTVSSTGQVIALLEPSLYLIAYHDAPGEVTINVRRFQQWRFFPTEAALLKFVEGQE